MNPKMKVSPPPDKDPTVIETVVLEDFDGHPVYVSEREASLRTIAACLVWAVGHPADVMCGLTLVSLAVASVYLMCDMVIPARGRR
jgi:hypothetical protein